MKNRILKRLQASHTARHANRKSNWTSKGLLVASIILGLSVSDIASAQVSHGGLPYMMTAGTKANINSITLDSIDNNRLIQEDIDMVPGSSPIRIGVEQYKDIDILKQGTKVQTANGRNVWSVEVVSPGAHYIAINFGQTNMAADAELFVYTPSGDLILGHFTQADVLPNGTFFTQALPGDRAIIEYSVPATSVNNGSLSIASLTHGYKNFLDDDMRTKGLLGNSDGICHIDVVCEDGITWRNQIRATVAITILSGSYQYICSGTLMNNTSGDKTPYVLTAHHCQDLSQPVSRYTAYFNYQRPNCGSGIGSISQSLIGATEVAKNSASSGSDFMLLRLTSNVPASYKAYYAGWDRTNVSRPSIGCGIHHPGGDYKKISFPCNVQQGSGSYLRFYRATWCNKGVTEQGSSGSALFNGDGNVIGQLYAGNSACNNATGSDYYGRLTSSWGGGGTAATRLSDWLDPAGTNVTVLQGLNYDEELDSSIMPTPPPTMQVYPNPTKGGAVHVSVENIGQAEYWLYTLDGLLIEHNETIFTATTQVINVGEQQDGIYVLVVEVAGQRYTSNVVVKR